MADLSVVKLTKIIGSNAEGLVPSLAQGYDKKKVKDETGKTVVLYDVSFDVREGECVAVVGPTGCGKTILLRCLALLSPTTAGSISLGGEDVTRLPPRAATEYRRSRVAMISERCPLFENRTVLENVSFALRLRGVDRRGREKAAREALALMGLENTADVYPSSLGPAACFKAAVARALACGPEILLIDEPYPDVDPSQRHFLTYELIKLMRRLGKTLIFTMHNPNDAFKLGVRVILLRDGRVEQDALPEEILKDPANDFVRYLVMDIDRTRVITARNIMTMPSSLIFESTGPHWAIREMKANGLSSVFVVNNEMRLRGLITIDGAVSAIKEAGSIDGHLIKDLPTASPDTSVNDLMPIAASTRFPISIVDEEGHLLGIVTRVSVIASLMGDDEVPPDGREEVTPSA